MKRTIRIGRAPGNDCKFDNSSVSGNHAILILDEDQMHGIIKDLGSTNGTYINNKRVTQDTEVGITDSIRLGSEMTNLNGILQNMNKTKIRPVTNTYPNGKTIGKNSDNNIVMSHDDVSRKHAVLYQKPDGAIVVEDLGSTNGTFVNGEKVTSRVLNAGDKVTITRNYPLNWEQYFTPVQPTPTSKPKPTTTIIAIACGVLIVLGCATWFFCFRTWDKEKIYSEYNQAVCWVYSQYGYQVLVDGEDFTPTLCQFFKLTPSKLVHISRDELKAGPTGAQGTAFFISQDGKLATNLHITRPWLFSDDGKDIELVVNKILAMLSTQNPMLGRSTVEVKGVLSGLYIIQNGLPLTDGNAIECDEIKGHDDINKDVAIIQTEKRALPSLDTPYLDITKADTSEKNYIEGKTVYTIGFPYGASIAMNSNNDLRNQVHSGSITQNKGDYEFGHDAETAGGASGSPIINDKGHLIGVHHAGMTGVTGAQGFNWGIKVKYVQELLNK